VEINKDAIRDAISNARLNQLRNCWFTVADAGEYMEQMARDKMRPELVFMDPPRAGSDERFIKSLLKCSPNKVVYISCNIETQKRDLEMICKGGYKVKKIQPVDMFPYTNHVESVVLLEREKNK
jgi:23S rRNA (uracil1939-C5)-methyltransferase